MIDRTRQPAFALHAAVFLLDQSADAILPPLDLTYRRYVVLLTVERLGDATQRAIAAELGVTEPAMSRVIRSLEAEGLVDTGTVQGNGNRRSVRLTAAGQQRVDHASDALESAFAGLLTSAGLTAADVLAVTDPIIRTLLAGADS